MKAIKLTSALFGGVLLVATACGDKANSTEEGAETAGDSTKVAATADAAALGEIASELCTCTDGLLTTAKPLAEATEVDTVSLNQAMGTFQTCMQGAQQRMMTIAMNVPEAEQGAFMAEFEKIMDESCGEKMEELQTVMTTLREATMPEGTTEEAMPTEEVAPAQ